MSGVKRLRMAREQEKGESSKEMAMEAKLNPKARAAYEKADDMPKGKMMKGKKGR